MSLEEHDFLHATLFLKESHYNKLLLAKSHLNQLQPCATSFGETLFGKTEFGKT